MRRRYDLLLGDLPSCLSGATTTRVPAAIAAISTTRAPAVVTGSRVTAGTPAAIAAARATKSTASCVLVDKRVRALRFEVAELLAVRALDAGDYSQKLVKFPQKRVSGLLTVTRLWALLANMSEFVTVAALDIGHILGLGAISGIVAFLTTIAATTTSSLRAILREVAHLIAFAALDTSGRTGLGAV